MQLPLNIDWQQILLHALNLVILVGGLYALLFKPVKKFMEQRAENYQKMKADAEDAKAQAESAQGGAERTHETGGCRNRRPTVRRPWPRWRRKRARCWIPPRHQAEKIVTDAHGKGCQRGKADRAERPGARSPV